MQMSFLFFFYGGEDDITTEISQGPTKKYKAKIA